MVYVTWILLAMWFAGVVIPSRRIPLKDQIPVLVLGTVAAAACAIRFIGFTGHHSMYVDEPWYEEAAKNFIHRGQLLLCESTWSGEHCDPYPKSAGWPAILVLAFKLLGTFERTALVAAAYVGCLAVPYAGMATRHAGGKWHHQLLAGALIALNPVFVEWWFTAETNVPAMTFLILGMIRMLLTGDGVARSRIQQAGNAAAIAGGLGVAAAIRPELWLAFVPVLILATRRTWIDPIAASVLVAGAVLGALPGLMSLGNYMTHNSGPLFALSNIWANTLLWLRAPGEAGWMSALIVATSIVGAIACVRRGRKDVAFALGGSTLLIGMFVLFYYPPTGFYSRTMLGAVAPATVLASLVLPDSRLGKFMAVFLVVALVDWTWQSREELLRAPETQVDETLLAEQEHKLTWPPNSLVVAEWPTVVEATSDLPTMSTSRAIEDWDRLDAEVARRPVFFACDMFCESSSDCRRLLDRYSLDPAETVGGPHRAYGFFRIAGPAPPGPHKPPCPSAP